MNKLQRFLLFLLIGIPFVWFSLPKTDWQQKYQDYKEKLPSLPKWYTETQDSGMVQSQVEKPSKELLELRDRLNEDDLMSSSQCGVFAERYTLLHKKIVSLPKNDPNRRIMLFDATCCGLSDRLQSVITAMAFALVTDRALKIKWKEEGWLEKVYDKPYVDWSYDANIDIPDDKSKILQLPTTESKEERFSQSDLRLWGKDKLLVRWEIGPGQLHQLYQNPYHRGYLMQEMGLDAFSSFACFYNYLFRPKLEVMKLLEPQLKLLGTTPEQVLKSYKWDPKVAGMETRPVFIGIQVRVGDDALHGSEVERCPTSDYQKALENPTNSYYFNCAERIEKDRVIHHQEQLAKESSKKLTALFYLLSDCKALRKAAKEHYKDRLITLEAEDIAHIETGAADDKRLRSLQLAVGEHFLFGLMDYGVITSWSSYGRCGLLRSLNTGTNIYRLNNDDVQKPIQCSEDNYTPWRALGM